MNPVVERIETALKSAEASLTSAESAAQVEEVRISMLGRKVVCDADQGYGFGNARRAS